MSDSATQDKPLRASKPRSGIYPANGGLLFVPTEDMRAVHEASRPTAILARADLGRKEWGLWKTQYEADHPWLSEWLYSSCAMPAGQAAGGFQPTDAMLAFRKEAKISAILAAAIRPPERMQEAWRRDYSPSVTDSLLSYWRRLYKQFDWFDRWLLRGGEPPAEVTVVTSLMARRCSRAWDYAAFCRRIGIHSDGTYVLWIRRKQIPDLDWLKWLFGAAPPAGAFVVSGRLQNLRREMGQKAILKKVGLNSATIWQWERGKLTSAPIKDILAGGDGRGAEGWDELNPDTQRHMEAVGKAASLDACCERAGLSVSTYRAAMQEAERCGVQDELRQYLNLEGRYTTTKSRQSGLVASNFFIPTRDMLRFREEAEREGAEQHVWSLQHLPGFDQWFLDWTAPKPHRGKRHLVPQGDVTAAHEQTNPEPARGLPTTAAGRNGRGTSTPDSDSSPATAPQPDNNDARTRPAREKHLKWKQWKEEGLSYNRIVIKHRAETGEKVTRDAVIQALRRLK